MASKFMVNAASKARLLLRPSHQRTVLFGTVNKLECSIPGRLMLPLILSSGSYSGSTSTPPLIIGEYGTGKTSLIELTLNGMDEPKGVIYVDMPLVRRAMFSGTERQLKSAEILPEHCYREDGAKIAGKEMNKSSPSLMELDRDWPIRRRFVVVAAEDIVEVWDKLKGVVALIKQVRDVSDMISEHEGVNAAARDSLGQDQWSSQAGLNRGGP